MEYFFLLNLFHYSRSATQKTLGATSAGSDSLSANEVQSLENLKNDFYVLFGTDNLLLLFVSGATFTTKRSANTTRITY